MSNNFSEIVRFIALCDTIHDYCGNRSGSTNAKKNDYLHMSVVTNDILNLLRNFFYNEKALTVAYCLNRL